MTDMKNRLSTIFKSLSEIKQINDLRDGSDHILFRYSDLYFFVYLTEGLGKLDELAHIVLANCIEIEEQYIEISKDILFHTMLKFENVRLFINSDNSVILYSPINSEDSQLTKKIKRCLKNILAAKDFFIDNYLMMTTFDDEM